MSGALSRALGYTHPMISAVSAGRLPKFQEVVFNQPLAQIVQLAAAAIHIREQLLTPASARKLGAGMEAAFDVGWMGSGTNRGDLVKLAPRVFPLHATVLPVLV